MQKKYFESKSLHICRHDLTIEALIVQKTMSNQSFIISLPDGTKKEYPRPVMAMDVALEISESLARNVLAAKVNGKTVDASMYINFDASLELLTWNDSEGKSTLWHSSAHLMAEALESLYPGIKLLSLIHI